MDRTSSLTRGERLLLLTLAEPLVFMPDGLLAPLPPGRVAELWSTAASSAPRRQPEPA